MTLILLSITTQSPVLLASQPPSHNLLHSLDFIPGNAVRGLLAQQYLSKGGKPEDTAFQRLFLSSETRFSFAYINGSQIVPRSARSCKYEPGFKADEGDGVVDILFSERERRCPKCNNPIDYFEGFWNPGSRSKQKVKKRLITRTAIDPVRGSASSGQLYTQQVIEEGHSFFTTIEIPDDLENELINLFSSDFVAGIGTGRSRGQGWVNVKQEPFSEPSWGEAKERFKKFPTKAEMPVLVVTLLSDAIFHDLYLRDCTAPVVNDIEPLGIKPDEWELKPTKGYASTRMVFGFDGIPLQLPRVPRLAVTGGSVFLFKAKEGVTPHIPEGSGVGWIGDNNREGFGKAILWNPFHVEDEKGVGL